MQTSDHHPPKQNITTRVLQWLGLTNQLTVKLYRGYGYGQTLVIYGHVLNLAPLPRKKWRQSVIRNTLALLRLFIVKPLAGARVQLEWKGVWQYAQTDEEGFFKLEWQDGMLEPGWYDVKASVRQNDEVVAQSDGHILVPKASQHFFISDIDDTFLISHSANMRKRLYVLFTQNAQSRQPFEGVVKHYQLLAAGGGATAAFRNPFFYVSSSEWNLFDYILEFVRINEIPQGVFLLSRLKRLSQIFKTGQNNHGTKFTRIVRILKNFPQQRFVLLGDSSQQDPYIYESVVEHFPDRIIAVYIRDVYARNREKAEAVLKRMESKGVHCCLFAKSTEAIIHSEQIGLIDKFSPDSSKS